MKDYFQCIKKKSVNEIVHNVIMNKICIEKV